MGPGCNACVRLLVLSQTPVPHFPPFCTALRHLLLQQLLSCISLLVRCLLSPCLAWDLLLSEDANSPVVLSCELFDSFKPEPSRSRAGLVNLSCSPLSLLSSQFPRPVFKTLIPLRLTISSTSHVTTQPTPFWFYFYPHFSEIITANVTNVSSNLCL